jgi:peroxiredoxin
MMQRTRSGISVLIATALLVGGAGVATLAVRSVFRASETEVASRAQPGNAPLRASPEAGAAAPAFEVPAYAGRQVVRLSAFRGHPIVLNFWASWCPPCRAEAGVLQAAYRKYRGRGVVVIGIDSQTDTWEESRAFLAQHGVRYPVGRDVTGSVARAYRVTALPTTYFIGADGRVQGPAVTGGFTGADGVRDLESGIERMLR